MQRCSSIRASTIPRELLQQGRRHAWTEMSALVREYRRFFNARDGAGKKRVAEAIRALSFQSVVQHYVRDALAGRTSVPNDLAKFVQRTASEWEWARAGRPPATA